MRRHRIALQGSRLIAGRSLADPVPDSAPWSGKCDVVIIGGGIVGTCVALYLAERGVDAVLLEKGVIAGEASGRAVGFVDSVMMAREKQAAIRCSKTLWADLDRRCGGAPSYRQSGLVFALHRESDLQAAAGWINRMGPETDARLLTPLETERMLPGTHAAQYRGALHVPSDGHAEPRRAAPAVAREAIRLGARVFQQCAARRIVTQDRRVRGVETERGLIRCDQVVVTAGVWTSLILRILGVDVPQLYGFATASEVASAPLPAQIGGSAGGVAFRPTSDGTHVVGPHLSLAPVTPAGLRNALRFRHVLRRLGHVVDLAPSLSHYGFMRRAEHWTGTGPSPFEGCRILEPERRRYSEFAALNGLAKTFRGGEEARLMRSWGGALATTPDNMPIIGPVPGYPQIQLACGMYYGFTFGPVAAALIASGLLQDVPPTDPTPFALERLLDGRPIRYMP